jgi:hypothetical protein
MSAHLLRAAGTVLAALLIASCGGGTSQVEPFKATRVIAFGDEWSALQPDGRKYTVNALDAAGTTIDCSLNPLWIQNVASLYGYRFKECLGTATEAKAVTWAAPGAKVQDLKVQIDQQEALGFVAGDLATVLVGMHDIKALYEGRGATPAADLVAQARQLGIDTAQQVNRLIGLGAKVIVATAPDVGITPYGVGKGTDDAKLLSDLSLGFNAGLRVSILQDGRFVGLALLDELIQTAVRFPNAYGLTNVTEQACVAALPDCTTATLASGASATAWLWADDLMPTSTIQLQLGSQAARLATNNPF